MRYGAASTQFAKLSSCHVEQTYLLCNFTMSDRLTSYSDQAETNVGVTHYGCCSASRPLSASNLSHTIAICACECDLQLLAGPAKRCELHSVCCWSGCTVCAQLCYPSHNAECKSSSSLPYPTMTTSVSPFLLCLLVDVPLTMQPTACMCRLL